MSGTFPAGRYFIKLNSEGRPTLYSESGEILNHPAFEAPAGEESSFTFEIEAPTPKDLFSFTQQPIVWLNQQGATVEQASAIYVSAVTITVAPPQTLTAEQAHRFQMLFALDGHVEELRTAEGVPLDPTIIEKPPED